MLAQDALGAAPTLKQLAGTQAQTSLVETLSSRHRTELTQPCREYESSDRNLASRSDSSGVIICGPRPRPDVAGEAHAPRTGGETAAAPEFALDYFDSTNEFVPEDSASTINAFLLAHLSMAVYSEASTSDDFLNELAIKVLPLGAEHIAVFNDAETGADAAVITFATAVIVVIRGTSTQGTHGPFADHAANADAVMREETLGGDDVRVHQGYWNAVDSIYDDVRAEVIARKLGYKEVWLTGHSLGGASATVMAARFHYDDNIPVQGLHLFGAPRVGAADFRNLTASFAENGVALADVTQRWEIYGDPATRFPVSYKKSICLHKILGKCVLLGVLTTDYVHIGTTNTIEFEKVGSNTDYFFDYDTGEIDHNVIPGISFAGLFTIHMEYEMALRQELERVLEINGDEDVLDFMP